MATSISIANRALTYLNSSRITSLTDSSENARKINAIYKDTRDALLAEHVWNFARTEATLSLLDETVTFTSEWTYIYQLPGDVINVIRMEGDARFAIKGRKVYTNESSCKIEYVKRVEDEGQFTPAFIEAFATRLARDLAYGITEDNTVVGNMTAAHERALNQAKWADAQEGIQQEAQYGSLTDFRG